MVGKTKRRERAERKARAMERKERREGPMKFEENGYEFNARQSKGGWLVTVRKADAEPKADDPLCALSREEFNAVTEHAIHAIVTDEPVMALPPMFSFFVRQDHEPRWGIDVDDMKRLEQFTDTVIALLPDIERIKKFLGDNFRP